jgi:PAS domain S-box-containing protein
MSVEPELGPRLATVLGEHIGTVLDRLGDGITVQGPGGELFYANEAGARLCGYDSPEELLSAPLAEVTQRFELFDEEGNPFELGSLPGRLALRGQHPPEALIRVRDRRSGATRWSLVQALPVTDAAGDVLFAVNLFRDVTDRTEAAERERFLARASALLASSLDYETILVNLAELAAPALADWCVVWLVDDEGKLRPLTWAHTNPDRVQLAEETFRRYPPVGEAIERVIESGEPVLMAEITDEMLVEAAYDDEHLALLRGEELRSFLAVPLAGRERVYGAVALITTGPGRVFDEADVVLANDLGRRAATAIENALLLRRAEESAVERERLLDSERAARESAERAAQMVAKLEEVTQAALRHVVSGDVLDEMLRQITRLVDADTSAILLVDEDGQFLTVRAALGFDREIENAVPIPLGHGMAGRVAASGKPVVIRDLGDVELASPHLRQRGIKSLVAIPITIGSHVIGVAHAGSVEPARFDEEDMRLLRLMADRIALAITQANAYDDERMARREVELAHRRLSFLAEASTLLAKSLDYESTLSAVARLAVPHLADWCVVDVALEGEELERIAVAHIDQKKLALVGDLERRWPQQPTDPTGPYAVLRSGSPELSPEVTEDLIVRTAQDDEHLAVLLDLGIRSYMCVPMWGRDRVLGALTFVTAESERSYTEADLALAEELARRAAVAVENALLYRQVEERARAARVLDAVADGVFLVDARGVVVLWNPAAEAITGLTAEAVVGRPAAEAVPGWEAVAPRVPVVSEVDRAVARAETVPLEIGGRELWLSISGVGFADGTVYAFRDLTQDRMLEELKADFVSTVSHELRTPLAAVYGAAMTLTRRDFAADEEQRGKLLSVIVQESERLATIVNDILWASRLDAESMRFSIQSCDAEALARGVIDAANVHRPQNIEIVVRSPEERHRVAGDPDKIRQVLVNLLDNAVKYSPDGGRIEIELEAGSASVRFSVHDEGLGVPPNEQRRIFEKFYRLDPNLTRGVGGTGLGLYICRELVHRMQGRLWVVSPRQEGKGSTFAFELPTAAHQA